MKKTLDEFYKEYIEGVYEARLGVYPSDKILNEILEILKKDSHYPNCTNDDIIIAVHNWLESIRKNGGEPISFDEADKYDLNPTKRPRKKTSLKEKVMKTYRFKLGVKPPEILLKQLIENLKSNSNYPNCHSGDINSIINNWLIGAANDKIRKIKEKNS
jgi:hypothetical protein